MDSKMAYKAYWYSEDVIIDGIQFRAKVDEVIWFMTHGSHVVPIKQDRLLYLYDETTMMKRSFYSISNDGKKRMDTVIEGIKAYEPTDLSQFKHAIFLIQTSKSHPLTMSELHQLQDITILLPSLIEITWGLGIDDTLDDRIYFTLVCSK